MSPLFLSLHFLLFSFLVSLGLIIVLFSVLLFIRTRLLSTGNGSSPCVQKISVSNTVAFITIANATKVQLSGIFRVSPLALQGSHRIVCFLLSFRFCECMLLFDYKMGMTAFGVVGVAMAAFCSCRV